ncbi:MAG: oxidoreductase of aldo/keto reductase family, subgroup 1, partial [uncultured Thermomicrobiales bacterium]
DDHFHRSRHHPEQRRHDPAARPRGLEDRPRQDSGNGSPRDRRRLPPHRRSSRLRQRARARGGDRVGQRPAGRAVHHDQALERRPGLRLDPGCLRCVHGQARAGSARPVPDPLADADPGTLRRDLAGLRADPGRRPRPGDRRVQLPDRGPPAPDRRLRDRPGGQPGGVAPAVPAGGAAPLPRRARDRDRGLESARPRSSARGPDDRRDCQGARSVAGPGPDPLAPRPRQHPVPEGLVAGADRPELRCLRLRPDGRRDGPDQRTGDRRARLRPRPGDLYRSLV